MPTWAEIGQKFDFLSDLSIIANISIKTLWPYAIHAIFVFLLIILVSLFLARHDQYFVMFKDSNVFELTNFPFKTKYNKTVVYSVDSNYLFSRKKNKKNCWNNFLIKSTVYLLIFRQNSMIFEGSPNSLTESYFTGQL